MENLLSIRVPIATESKDKHRNYTSINTHNFYLLINILKEEIIITHDLNSNNVWILLSSQPITPMTSLDSISSDKVIDALVLFVFSFDQYFETDIFNLGYIRLLNHSKNALFDNFHLNLAFPFKNFAKLSIAQRWILFKYIV